MRRMAFAIRNPLLILLLATGQAAASQVDACLDCHGGSGRRPLAPNLDGQHALYLQAQLLRFRAHARQAFPMEAFSQGMDDRLVGELAVAFSQRAWTVTAMPVDAEQADRGRDLLKRFDCAACHGAEFVGGGEVPRLAGQHADYLQRQLRAFGDDARAHPPTGTGAPMSSLDDDQRAAIAAALASASGAP